MVKICVHNDGLGRCAVSGEHCTDGPCDCEDLIEYEPVRHGRWEWRPVDDVTSVHTCSVCFNASVTWEDTNYCPNCGAKMDGDF